jgi:hypothetical protein
MSGFEGKISRNAEPTRDEFDGAIADIEARGFPNVDFNHVALSRWLSRAWPFSNPDKFDESDECYVGCNDLSYGLLLRYFAFWSSVVL